MNTEMNGKDIKFIDFPDGDELTARNGLTMHLSASYHGDRDEFWVVVKKNGKEIARHNCQHIRSVVWE